MPRVVPITGKSDVPAEYHEVVDGAEGVRASARAVQRAADQAAFDALKNRHGVQWLVELTAAANYYGFLSGIVNAFEVPAPPDGDKLPM